jgi:hypothetical protein
VLVPITAILIEVFFTAVRPSGGVLAAHCIAFFSTMMILQHHSIILS